MKENSLTNKRVGADFLKNNCFQSTAYQKFSQIF